MPRIFLALPMFHVYPTITCVCSFIMFADVPETNKGTARGRSEVIVNFPCPNT